MKIISNPFPKRITCPNCNAILEYEASDIFTKPSGRGKNIILRPHACIKCPCCKKDMSIE